jgi:GH25 family lysozyme M1 (1,4-beta-N-acetylmuramidase)
MALYGIDESVYQGTLDGQDFSIIRATAGNSYVDPTCDTKYQQNKRDDKLLGVYHYAYPGLNDPISEAAFFVSNIQGYLGEALLVLDFETNTNVGWAKTFLDHVYSLTKVRPMIYMSASTSNAVNWSSVSGQYALYEAGYPAKEMVANPPTPNASGSDMPFNSGTWGFATIWQYSDSAGKLDRDIAYMTADAWHKFAQGDRNTQPTPAPAPAPQPAPAPVPTPVPMPAPVEPPAPVTPPVGVVTPPSNTITVSVPVTPKPTPAVSVIPTKHWYDFITAFLRWIAS